MTRFKQLTTTSALCVLGLFLTACTQEEADASPQQSAEPEITQVSAPAEPQAPANDQTSHDAQKHDHRAPTAPPVPENVEHVFDFAPNDHLLGAANAPVEMIIYASVTCGHCGTWFTNDWPILKSKYVDSGKIRVAFREIPTAPTEVSIPGFIIANCAPAEKYMDIIVHQMQNQKKTFEDLGAGKGQEVFMNLAAMAGMNSEAELKTCFDDPSHQARFVKSDERFRAAGMSGVPGVIIDGKVFESNDKSASELSSAIDKLLK